MRHANPTLNPNHPEHDLLLIAGHAAGDLAESESPRAQSLLDTCAQCTDLHRDLIAITAATRSLPNLATAPRDFRLTPEQAAGLRRTGWLRTILAPLIGAKSAARPMAAAFTTLGIAGLLVATMLPGLAGFAGGAASLAGPARDQTTTAAGATAAPAGPVNGGGQPAPAASAGSPDSEFGTKDGTSPSGAPEIANGGARSPGPNGPTAVPVDAPDDRLSTSSPNPLLIGSVALLAAGIVLYGLQLAGRRLR
ncbi:MAG: hypothetical protein HYX55_09955 [Chloroflexi bacterium]|nr:hypothetical protein [Chloroflexota bacterium]